MKIQARKCYFTGKVFTDDTKYFEHLMALRAGNAENRKKVATVETFTDWLNAERAKSITIELLPEWFMDNQRKLMDGINAGVPSSPRYHGDKFYATDKFTKIEFERIKYCREISNTHVCPDSGVTNWYGKHEEPTGYIGWKGQISGSLKRLQKHEDVYPYSSALNLAGFKTGSGGGGNSGWRYDVSIFLDDWPGLGTVQSIEEKIIADKLEQDRLLEIKRVARQYERDKDRIIERLSGNNNWRQY